MSASSIFAKQMMSEMSGQRVNVDSLSMDLNGYSGKLNKSGMPDMRTKEGKLFMAS
jgi:hypothetical protein